MNSEPAWQMADRIWSEMRPLLDELLAAQRSPRAPGVVPAFPGIYVLTDDLTQWPEPS